MILAILQARVTSSRLPGKVLKPVLGEPMLLRQIERIQRSRLIDRLVIATSTDHTNDAIEKMCTENQLSFFRGSLNDVLDRFYQAAMLFKPLHVVRLTGDCPLTDPDLIDEVVSFHLKGNFDYTSNALEPTYPDGLDVEIMRFSCLSRAWEEASLPSEREHVTSFIYKRPDLFKIGSVKGKFDLSFLRWTVDEPLDFELISNVYERLYPINPQFTTEHIYNLLKDNPELQNINAKFERNEGYQRSLLLDVAVANCHDK